MTETDLIERAREGDQEALRVLFERYAAPLRRRLRKRLSRVVLRKVSIADVLQEAYLAAHQRLADFEEQGEGSFGRWLGGIVDRKALHAVRRYAGTDKRGAVGEVSRHLRGDTANFVGAWPSPSQIAMTAELEEAARRAMAALPDDYREVLRLRQEEQLSLGAAAKRLGRSKEAARKLYSRALARLAELLDL